MRSGVILPRKIFKIEALENGIFGIRLSKTIYPQIYPKTTTKAQNIDMWHEQKDCLKRGRDICVKI